MFIQGVALLAAGLSDNSYLKTLRLQGNLSDQVFEASRPAYADV